MASRLSPGRVFGELRKVRLYPAKWFNPDWTELRNPGKRRASGEAATTKRRKSTLAGLQKSPVGRPGNRPDRRRHFGSPSRLAVPGIWPRSGYQILA